ncbi:HAD family hydrolase [Streptomyces massasporeus]|uniref:HAD family hydrolase n=1 Tax=Streptomyces massasporeus TaxID=67324 RepID=A0ABW6L5Q8_9ACTN
MDASACPRPSWSTLFDYLREHGRRVFVCSGGGRDFMRVIREET